MLDISSQLFAVAHHRGPRGNDRQQRLLRDVLATVQGAVDWDWDAGEDWARIVDGDEVRAYIAMEMPLIICLGTLRRDLKDVGSDVEIIEVADWDDLALCARREALTAAFGDAWEDVGFDPLRFSAQKLWFYTV